TARALQNLLAAVVPLCATFYAGHGWFSFLRFCLCGWRQEAIIDCGQPLHSLLSSLISRLCERFSQSAGANWPFCVCSEPPLKGCPTQWLLHAVLRHTESCALPSCSRRLKPAESFPASA